jgi:hypothetical protein
MCVDRIYLLKINTIVCEQKVKKKGGGNSMPRATVLIILFKNSHLVITCDWLFKYNLLFVSYIAKITF